MTREERAQGRDERHKDQVRRSNRARYRAVQLLISENPERFLELYTMTGKAEGIVPHGSHQARRAIRAEKLQEEIQELKRKLGVFEGRG